MASHVLRLAKHPEVTERAPHACFNSKHAWPCMKSIMYDGKMILGHATYMHRMR